MTKRTWPSRHCSTLLSIAVLFLMRSTTLEAGNNIWTGIGPEGGAIRTMAFDPQNPNIIYAASYTGSFNLFSTTFNLNVGGVFRSSDGGTTWVNAGWFPGCSTVSLLTVDPQNSGTVYATTQCGGVLKTTDGAATWSAVNAGLPAGSNGNYATVNALAIDPQNPRTIYAGTEADVAPVYKSTNGGATWTAAGLGLPVQHGVLSLAIDPRNSATLYAGVRGGGLYKSANGGAAWTAANTGMRPFSSDSALVIDPKQPNTLYTWNGDGLFKSTDGGSTWSQPKPGLPFSFLYSLAIDAQNTSVLYAGIYCCDVFKSTDGGTSWVPTHSGVIVQELGGNSFIYVTTDARGTVYASGPTGFFKSMNGGTNWSAASFAGLAATRISSIVADPQNPRTLYTVISAPSPSGVFKTSDGGASWRAVNLPCCVSALGIDAQNTSTVYAGTGGTGTGNAGAFKSTDSGTGWTKLRLPAGNGAEGLATDPQIPGTLYAWNSQGFFKSTDGAASWSTLRLPCTVALCTLAVTIDSQSTVYVVNVAAGVLKSTDGGASWTAASSGLPKELGVRMLAADPQRPGTVYAWTGWYDAAGAKLFKTVDGGASWSLANSGLQGNSISALAIDPRNSNTVYAAANGYDASGAPISAVFQSADAGAHWSVMNPGPPNRLAVNVLVFDRQSPRTLYAGTNGGGVFAITFVP